MTEKYYCPGCGQELEPYRLHGLIRIDVQNNYAKAMESGQLLDSTKILMEDKDG